MTVDEFWKLMDAVDRAVLGNGQALEDVAVASLIDALSVLDTLEIESFEDHLAKALFALDGEVYADNAGDSGRSGDGFLYARCYVVGKGVEFYRRVLENPTQMPDRINQWLEPLLFVAARAWARATGGHEEDWDYQATVSWETGSNSEQW